MSYSIYLKYLFLKSFFVLFFCSNTIAQKRISGYVIDKYGEPLIAANILCVGTSTGTLTDFDGKFSLYLPRGVEYILVSYSGFKNKKIPVTQTSNNVTIQMSPQRFGNGKKILFLEVSGNLSPYSIPNEERDKKFSDYIIAYGANAGATLYLFRSYRTPIFAGIEGNYQYDRYRSSRELDFFKKKVLFDLFTTSIGLNIGYEFDSFSDFHGELMLKGGMIINSYVEQKIESDNFQILTTEPFGKYVDLQINLVKSRGSGFFTSFRFWFDKKIESNLNSVFSIDALPLNIPSNKLTIRVGCRLGIF